MPSVTPNLRLGVPDYAQNGWDTIVNNNWQIIDSLLNRAAGVVLYAGIYAAGTSYLVNQTVTDPADNRLWQTNLAYTTSFGNTFAQERAAFPGRWTDVTSSIASAASAAATAAGSATTAQQAATTAGTAATAAAASATSAANAASILAASGGATKNAVINGGFTIAQRGTSITIPPNVPTWSLDRWKASHDGTGGTTTVTQAANTAGALLDAGLPSALRYQVSAPSTSQTYRNIQTQMESVSTFSGRQVTVSFWAWATTGTPTLTAFLSQYFGTGGSPSAQLNLSSFGFLLTASPQLYSFTVSVPSISGKTLGTALNDFLALTIQFPNAIQNTFITGVQVELGSGATPFAYRPVAAELALCQRYYQTGQVWFSASSSGVQNVGYNLPLLVTMKAIPTFVFTGMTYTNASGVSAGNITLGAFVAFAAAAGAGAVFFGGLFNATAEIQ